FVAFGPDGKLYVPVGAPCNICTPPGPLHATITRLDLAGGRPEVVARGVRNSVGFDFDPTTGDLWFTDNGRDWLGDDQPPDELNHLTKVGEHFGFPFCHGNGIRDPEHNAGRSCGEFTAPARELGPHVAAIGMRFYTGRMFPEKYRGGIFIAEHGSWNRSTPIGYRVSFVKIENGRAAAACRGLGPRQPRCASNKEGAMDAWTTNSVQTAERVSAFLWKVYGWMAVGLGLTAVVAFAVAGSPDLLRVLVGNRLVFFALVIAELGLVFFMSARADRLSPGTASGLFALYSALNGVTLSVILLAYTG